LVLGSTVLVVWVLGTITEKKKHDLRRALLRVYDATSEKILQVLRLTDVSSENDGNLKVEEPISK
jgi:hypothetical protein